MASCCVVVELRTFADVHVISASFADVLTALTLMPVRRQVITSLIATVSAHRPPPAGWLKPGRNYKIIIQQKHQKVHDWIVLEMGILKDFVKHERTFLVFCRFCIKRNIFVDIWQWVAVGCKFIRTFVAEASTGRWHIQQSILSPQIKTCICRYLHNRTDPKCILICVWILVA